MFAHAVTTVSAARPHRPRTLVWFGLFSALMVEVCAQTTPAVAVRGTPTGTGTVANSPSAQKPGSFSDHNKNKRRFYETTIIRRSVVIATLRPKRAAGESERAGALVERRN